MDKQAGERSVYRVGATQARHWKLWCFWVMGSLAAGTVAAFLFHVGLVTEATLVGISAMFGLLLVPGVVLGVMQFLVLRRHVAMSGTWIPITALGWAVGWALGATVGSVVGLVVGGGQLMSITGNADPGKPWSSVVMLGIGGVIAGLVMGSLQVTVLRTYMARSVVWILVSAVAMAVGGCSVGVVMWWGEINFTYNYNWSAVVASLLYGAITGYGLMLLLRQSGADACDSTTEHV